MAEDVLPWAVNDVRDYYSLQLDGSMGLAHLIHHLLYLMYQIKKDKGFTLCCSQESEDNLYVMTS